MNDHLKRAAGLVRETSVRIGATFVSHGRYVTSKWLRLRCRGRCSKKSCISSPGCGRRWRLHDREMGSDPTTTAKVRLDQGRAACSGAARRATRRSGGHGGDCDQISLRRASPRRKIALGRRESGECRVRCRSTQSGCEVREMPYSEDLFDNIVKDMIKLCQPATVVDIGPGAGKYGQMLRDIESETDHVMHKTCYPYPVSTG